MCYSDLKPDANYVLFFSLSPDTPYCTCLCVVPLTARDSIQNMLVSSSGIVFWYTLPHFNHSFAVLVWPSGSAQL